MTSTAQDAFGNDQTYFDDMQQGLAAEIAALQQPPIVPVAALPDKAYLEATVLPLLLHGLEAVANERPKDPVEFLAAYLLSNNPQRDAALPTPPAEHPMLMGCLPPAASGEGVAGSALVSAAGVPAGNSLQDS